MKKENSAQYAYDLDGETFYKISKSRPEIARLCSEDHYLDYLENEIIHDFGEHRICFIPAKYAILCIHYGDQLTEIKFDSNDPRFAQIANERIYRVDSRFDEYSMKTVITGKNYSLADPETIEIIANMASKESLFHSINVDECKEDRLTVSHHLKKLGFLEALYRWQEIKERYR